MKDGEIYRHTSSNLNIPFTKISYFIARFESRSTVEKQKRTGVPRKISPRLSRKLGHLIKQNPMVTSEELQEYMRSSGCNVTKRTIRNYILRNGLNSRRPKKTLLQWKRHRDARLKLLRPHKEKENSFRERISCTNETKIELFG